MNLNRIGTFAFGFVTALGSVATLWTAASQPSRELMADVHYREISIPQPILAAPEVIFDDVEKLITASTDSDLEEAIGWLSIGADRRMKEPVDQNVKDVASTVIKKYQTAIFKHLRAVGSRERKEFWRNLIKAQVDLRIENVGDLVVDNVVVRISHLSFAQYRKRDEAGLQYSDRNGQTPESLSLGNIAPGEVVFITAWLPIDLIPDADDIQIRHAHGVIEPFFYDKPNTRAQVRWLRILTTLGGMFVAVLILVSVYMFMINLIGGAIKLFRSDIAPENQPPSTPAADDKQPGSENS